MIISLIITVIGFLILSSIDNKIESNMTVFHVTLADPKLYKDDVFSANFTLDEGDYSFRFVPNGDSPKSLSILLKGEKLDFSENFKLVGTLHETGISEYYTWDYEGNKRIKISEKQMVIIEINPNGNFLGSVSVDILEN